MSVLSLDHIFGITLRWTTFYSHGRSTLYDNVIGICCDGYASSKRYDRRHFDYCIIHIFTGTQLEIVQFSKRSPFFRIVSRNDRHARYLRNGRKTKRVVLFPHEMDDKFQFSSQTAVQMPLRLSPYRF